jgi:hypothetical protein
VVPVNSILGKLSLVQAGDTGTIPFEQTVRNQADSDALCEKYYPGGRDLAWNDARDAATRILSALCDSHGRNSAMTVRLPGLMDAMTHSLSLQVLRDSNPFIGKRALLARLTLLQVKATEPGYGIRTRGPWAGLGTCRSLCPSRRCFQVRIPRNSVNIPIMLQSLLTNESICVNMSCLRKPCVNNA